MSSSCPSSVFWISVSFTAFLEDQFKYIVARICFLPSIMTEKERNRIQLPTEAYSCLIEPKSSDIPPDLHEFFLQLEKDLVLCHPVLHLNAEFNAIMHISLRTSCLILWVITGCYTRLIPAVVFHSQK